MEIPNESLRPIATAALEVALKYYATVAERPIFSQVDAAALARSLDEALPTQATQPEVVLEEFCAKILPNCRNNGHPLMTGYVVSGGSWMGVLGDFLASTINQNVTAWRSAPGPSVVEHVVVRWIAESLGYAPTSSGLLVSGGSMANLTALAAALYAKAPVDIGREGLRALQQEPVFYASDLVHLSVAKGLGLLGVGSNALRKIAHDANGRLIPSALLAALHEDRLAGRLPVAVIANAGDVNIGAVDDLEALAALCADTGLWLHVDASYGGFAALAPTARAQFRGMAAADSVAVDAHKWLSVPIDAGCVLVKDQLALRRAFSHDAAYISVLSDAPLESFAFWDYGPELSRRFRALKIWFALKTYGAHAIGAAIEANLQAVRALALAIDAAEDFERLAPVGLSIVCFRHVPAALAARLASRDPEVVRAAEAAANEHNRQLLQAVQKAGHAYPSNALLQGRFALRVCAINHRASATSLTPLLDILRAEAKTQGLES